MDERGNVHIPQLDHGGAGMELVPKMIHGRDTAAGGAHETSGDSCCSRVRNREEKAEAELENLLSH